MISSSVSGMMIDGFSQCLIVQSLVTDLPFPGLFLEEKNQIFVEEEIGGHQDLLITGFPIVIQRSSKYLNRSSIKQRIVGRRCP